MLRLRSAFSPPRSIIFWSQPQSSAGLPLRKWRIGYILSFGTRHLQAFVTQARPGGEEGPGDTAAPWRPKHGRSTKFSYLAEEDLAVFRTILGLGSQNGDKGLQPSSSIDSGLQSQESPESLPANVEMEGLLANSERMEVFNRDWTGKYRGSSRVVLFPKTTEQVREILSYCNSRTLAVVPQGGNTGLVGGGVPVFDEIILSMRLMNKICSFDDVTGVLLADAGCTLQSAQEAARASGFVFPVDLGAKKACQLGGLVSTNAAGLRWNYFGSLNGTVLGLEVVCADGRTLNLLSEVKKDNSGPKLHQMFIGSEGIFGVVTKVAVKCPPAARSSNVAIIRCPSFQALTKAVAAVRGRLGALISAMEYFDATAFNTVMEQNKNVYNPFSEKDRHRVKHPSERLLENRLAASLSVCYLLIETMSSQEEGELRHTAMTALQRILKGDPTHQLFNETVFADTRTETANLWAIREGISPAFSRQVGRVFKYDVSLPTQSLYKLVEAVKTRVKEATIFEGTGRVEDDVVVSAYGHIADGNIHINVLVRRDDLFHAVEQLLEPWIWFEVIRCGGSVSAEHGIGIQKTRWMRLMKGESQFELMRRVKQLVDPNGILNPYKLIYESPDNTPMLDEHPQYHIHQ